MSYLSDLLGDAYKEGMTEEEISTALQRAGAGAKDNEAEVNRLKAQLSKANSEAADYKKQLRGTVTYIDYVSTAIYLMHFLHGGRGVAFGQKATMDNTLDCAFKALFREDVTIVKKDGTQVSMREVLEKLGF